jgi:hypothetical protein
MAPEDNIDRRTVRHIVELTMIQMADMLGVGKTEMSYSKASATFGKFFRDMVKSGKLKPCRYGEGRNGTHWYSLRDILSLRYEEEMKAVIPIQK